jgi:hypothetical protein
MEGKMSPNVTADVLDDVASLLTGGPASSAKDPKKDPRDDASPAGQRRKLHAVKGPYDSTAADVNGDGIPDELEARSGLNLQAGNLNGTGDEDGDGINNLQEYREGRSIETPEPSAAAPGQKPDILMKPVVPLVPDHPEPSAGAPAPKKDLTDG